MALEADRMANLQFDAKEFAKEIRVIMEERRWRTDDQPMGLLNEALNAAAWTAHPYHHPVVGWMDDLRHMSVQDIANWYRQWYAPNNATLVVAGDVDAQRVLALAKKYFGKIPSHPVPVGKPQNEPEQGHAPRHREGTGRESLCGDGLEGPGPAQCGSRPGSLRPRRALRRAGRL
jgi:zinc protease